MNMRKFRRRMCLLICFVCIPLTAWTAYLVLTRSLPLTRVAYASPPETEAGYAVTTVAPDASFDLAVPLPPDAHYEDVALEHDYARHCLAVRIRTAQSSFYEDNPVQCNPEKIPRVFCHPGGESLVTLLISCNALYEFDFRLDNETVRAVMQRPAEIYAHTVVIDPVYEAAGADHSLALARRIAAYCETAFPSVKVYLTRTEKERISPAQVSALVADTQSARYLRIEVPGGEGGTPSALSVYDGFFLRGYGSAQFAYDIARALFLAEYPVPGEITAVSDDAYLSVIKIPAVSLRIGNAQAAAGEAAPYTDTLVSALAGAIRIGFEEENE